MSSTLLYTYKLNLYTYTHVHTRSHEQNNYVDVLLLSTARFEIEE